MLNILYLNFANSAQSPLPSLQEEDTAVQRVLLNGQLQRHFLVQREQYASLQIIADNLLKFGNDITLFHYSGHAGNDRLVTEDGAAHITGIARLLGNCRRLKAVVLNGCSTKGQVQHLLDAGVPLVIATSAKVDDTKATRFSIRFYQSLAEMATFKQAFEFAAAEAQAIEGSLKIHRDAMTMADESSDEQAGVWGIFCAPGKESILEERLPRHSQRPGDDAFKPNEKLLPSLWQALSRYSDRIKYASDADTGEQSVLVINNLPMPIGEQVRKLLCPVSEEDEGFDKENENRLRQIIRSWQVTMEMLSFTMLTQLWEALLLKNDLEVPAEAAEEIRHFFNLNEQERVRYDLLRLITAVRRVLDGNDIEPFVDELPELRRLLDEDEGFKSAMSSLRMLHDQIAEGNVNSSDIWSLCRHAEIALSEFFADLGFLARYQIISVHGIDIEKYRHLLQPVFHHNIVSKRAFGTESKRTIKGISPMDNRSVLLEKTGYSNGLINLSPFLFDANSFDNKADKLSLYYFAARDEAYQEYCYKHINDTRQSILVSSSNYKDVEPQLNYFIELLSQRQSAA